MTKSARTVVAGIILNLVIFILVTSSQNFQDLHHHWIFPVMGLILSAQWALAGGLFRISRLDALLDLKAARSVLLFTLGILLLMGVVRHQTILACFGRCSFKLSLAMFMGAVVYGIQARLGDDSFWSPARAATAALACGLWAVFLALFGLGLQWWKLDILFIAISAAGLFWRRFRAVRMVISAIVPILLIRRLFGENTVIFANLLIICFGVAAVTLLTGKKA